jgi:hypothetical protein
MHPEADLLRGVGPRADRPSMSPSARPPPPRTARAAQHKNQATTASNPSSFSLNCRTASTSRAACC